MDPFTLFALFTISKRNKRSVPVTVIPVTVVQPTNVKVNRNGSNTGNMNATLWRCAS